MKFFLHNNQTSQPGVYKKEILFYRYYKVVCAHACVCDVSYDFFFFFMAGHHVAIFFFFYIYAWKKPPHWNCVSMKTRVIDWKQRKKKKHTTIFEPRKYTDESKMTARRSTLRDTYTEIYKKNRPEELFRSNTIIYILC